MEKEINFWSLQKLIRVQCKTDNYSPRPSKGTNNRINNIVRKDI
jgi:hypothetical protein